MTELDHFSRELLQSRYTPEKFQCNDPVSEFNQTISPKQR